MKKLKFVIIIPIILFVILFASILIFVFSTISQIFDTAPQKELTSETFKAISANYDMDCVRFEDNEFKTSGLKAKKGDLEIFFVKSNNSSKLFSTIKNKFIDTVQDKTNHKSITLDNFNFYECQSDDQYYIVSATKHVIVYCSGKIKNLEDVKAFLVETEYYPEFPFGIDEKINELNNQYVEP